LHHYITQPMSFSQDLILFKFQIDFLPGHFAMLIQDFLGDLVASFKK